MDDLCAASRNSTPRLLTLLLLLTLTLPACAPARNAFAPLVGVWEAGPEGGGHIGGAEQTPPERRFRSVTLHLRGDQTYTVDWAIGEMALREGGSWFADRLAGVLRLSGDRVTGGEADYAFEGSTLVLTGRRELPWGRLRVRLTRAPDGP